MSLGDLRKFLSSLENLPDESSVRARVTLRKQLRSITVDDDDLGFQDYIRKVRLEDETDAKVESKAK
jgi:hypothetical protein